MLNHQPCAGPFHGGYVCIVSGLAPFVCFFDLYISFRASFFDLIDLFLKVCARYRGRGGWQPGPEIIWLLLRHEASRGRCDHHRLCSNQTVPLTLLGLHGYLRIRIPFVTFPVSCYVPKGACPMLSIRGLCAVSSVASYLVNTIGQNKRKCKLKFILYGFVWDEYEFVWAIAVSSLSASMRVTTHVLARK